MTDNGNLLLKIKMAMVKKIQGFWLQNAFKIQGWLMVVKPTFW